ncbi:MAG: sulfite exporter TauE/SafE family protein, partial [Desulfurobacteriaceae bacterium]
LAVGVKILKGVGSVKVRLSEKILIPVATTFSAFLSSLLGIGGGIVINSLLFSFSKIKADKIVALASVVSFFNALFGSLMYMMFPSVELLSWQIGYVYLPAVILVSLGAIPGSRVGLSLLAKLSQRSLKKLFAILLIIIAIKILFV